MATSSAEPERLYRYSDVGLSLDSEIKTESARLRGSLAHFESTCREAGFRLGVMHHAASLGSYGSECEPIDSWVRRVGAGFLSADSGGFGASPIQIGRWYPWRSILGVEVWLPIVKILPVPSWLADVLDTVRWAKGRPTPVPTPQQSNVPAQAGLVPPSSPIGEFDVTAYFPSYGDGKGHSGIDIVPKPYDPAKTYPVHPLGPGVVIKRESELYYDREGNTHKRAYGNNVIVQHTLGDGTSIYVRYAHLQKLPTIEGTVNTDSVLGNMGSTGRSSGPHLHLEICTEENFPWDYQYQDHQSEELIPGEDPPITYKQAMMKDYVDPLPIIEGKSDWLLQSQASLE